ncbi:MAG: protein-glutamate O-methyltransferase CheR [Planctomycetaceae bacterium]|nr:protein-glutamate O-methyltransferase CheR [Planctomycetaceae bacterium]
MSFAQVAEVSDAQMDKFCDLIYRTTGVRIPRQKKTLMTNRLRRRLRETNLADFDAYYKLLCTVGQQHPEWVSFLQEITTHVTYLFRDQNQWDWLRDHGLKEAAADARAFRRTKTYRVWSAACSTGDEATTIGCCISAGLPDFPQWKVQILGTDIGADAVAQAQKLTFDARAMNLVPDAAKRNYFVNQPDGSWKAKPTLASLMTFRTHNLMKPLTEAPFDLIVLKNVMIYFDAESKRTVLGHVRKVLKTGGYLITDSASTEGTADVLRSLTRLQPWLYRRDD